MEKRLDCSCDCHKTKYACDDCIGCPLMFKLGPHESLALYNFLLYAGYINHEDQEPIHAIFERLKEYVRNYIGNDKETGKSRG